jgi:hypothetical protein
MEDQNIVSLIEASILHINFWKNYNDILTILQMKLVSGENSLKEEANLALSKVTKSDLIGKPSRTCYSY